MNTGSTRSYMVRVGWRSVLIPLITALYGMMSPLHALAESIILNCTYTEVLTGTNGAVMTYSMQRTIKTGGKVYRVWSSKDADWGKNECNLGRCTFNDKTFSYERNDVNTYDGSVLENREQLTIDRATGRMAAEKKTSTTTSMTGYQAETTWYDEGTCVSGTDPAALKKRS
jgi:hypothetical protein